MLDGRAISKLLAVLPLAGATGCALVLGFGDPVQVAAGDDGGTDAGLADAADGASALPFCSTLVSRPVFCASFDDDADYLGEWLFPQIRGGTYTRDSRIFVSPPAAFAATKGAWVHRDFFAWAGRPLIADVSLQLRIDEADPSNALAVVAEPFVLTSSDGSPLFLLQLVARATSADRAVLNLTELEGPAPNNVTQHVLPGEVARSAWVNVRVVVALRSISSAATNTLTAYVDGKQRFEEPLVVRPVAGTPRTSAGITYAEGGPWTVRYDNVVVDFRTP